MLLSCNIAMPSDVIVLRRITKLEGNFNMVEFV